MGHDIKAYADSPSNPIAKIRMQERVGAQSMLYHDLDSSECNATNSGNGTTKTFTIKQIKKARQTSLNPNEINFLNSIINANVPVIKIEFA